MRGVFFLTLFSVLFSVVSGQSPSGYYDQASGLTGEALQIALYNIIKGHTSVSYDNVWSAFYHTDAKSNGKVWDMYSDVPGGTPPYEFTFGTKQCGSGGGGVEGDCYSREHSFPKSWFNELTPMYTDLFHLYPVDQYVNNHRSDNPYGTVSSASWTSLNGSKVGTCSAPGYTGTVFEPIDEYKGDLARTYFYMATRYENVIATWKNNNVNGAAILDGTSYPVYQTWYLNMLIQWHIQDPVSPKEIARNDSIFKIQHNRNPYIDHPEYVAAVWTPTGPKPEPSNHVTGFTATTGIPPYSTMQLTWIDATGTVIPDGYLIRGSNTGYGNIAAPTDGIVVPDGGLDKSTGTGNQTCTISGLSSNAPYYFKIFPYTNAGAWIDYKTDGVIPSATGTTTTGISILQPGDIAIIEVNASDTDKVSFLTLKQLSAGTIINFTDNGFNNSNTVRQNEGFLIYTAPMVIPVGTVVSWRYGMTVTGTGWNTSTPGNFALSTSGDQVFAFQGTWGSGQTMIFGVQTGNASWLTTGTATSNTSYLPSALASNATAITFLEKNGKYSLITAGSVNALGSLVANPPNWTKSNSIQTTPVWSFGISNTTNINQNATVQNLTVGTGEVLTILPGIVLTVSGNITIN